METAIEYIIFWFGSFMMGYAFRGLLDSFYRPE